MIDYTNKQKGNCGLGMAIGYFSTHGYIDLYLIPIKEIKNRSTLNLCAKYEKYKLN